MNLVSKLKFMFHLRWNLLFFVFPNTTVLSSCVGLCVCARAHVYEGSCGLQEPQRSPWLRSAVPAGPCDSGEILCGTLANDPIKPHITTELTRDYTAQKAAKEREKCQTRAKYTEQRRGLLTSGRRRSIGPFSFFIFLSSISDTKHTVFPQRSPSYVSVLV